MPAVAAAAVVPLGLPWGAAPSVDPEEDPDRGGKAGACGVYGQSTGTYDIHGYDVGVRVQRGRGDGAGGVVTVICVETVGVGGGGVGFMQCACRLCTAVYIIQAPVLMSMATLSVIFST